MFSSLLSVILLELAQPSDMLISRILPPRIVFEAPHLSHAQAPQKKTASIGPIITAQSAFAIDFNSKMPLFIDHIFEERPIASITKLMTAMLIADQHGADEIVTVPEGISEVEGSRIYLRPGEIVTIEQLLRGLLIHSGNDAARALAQINSGSEANFVSKMNQRAQIFGMRSTHFTDAAGLDDAASFSNAYDVMLMSIEAMNYPLIRSITSRPRDEFVSLSGIRHTFESTNQLLTDPYFEIKGLKTGTTEGAGESLVTIAEGPQGHTIITVILGSRQRFQDTKILLDWIFRNYSFPSN